LEKAGIPTVQITSAVPVARMVGANRVVLGNGIVHVVGADGVPYAAEKKLRRQLIERALQALQSEGG
jgi:glycine reductase